MEPLKKEFLELLDRDLEFRYAVAGYFGLSEVLKRLDALAEEQASLRKEQAKIWEEVRALREEQVRLREEQVKLREEATRIWGEIAKIWEEVRALREEQVRLREDFNKMYRQLDVRLTRVERTLEKLTLDIEEEARIVVKHRLKEAGCEVEVAPLILPELEVNIYGAANDLCVVGEALVRASSRIIDEVDWKVERLKSLYPDRLRPKLVKIVYTSLATPDLIERAEKEGVWVLKATGDIVKPKGLQLSLCP